MSTTTSSKAVLAPVPSRFNGNKQKYMLWKNLVKEYFVAYNANFGKILPITANMADVVITERMEAITRRINFILALMKAENNVGQELQVPALG
jgi:hypothetical protein